MDEKGQLEKWYLGEHLTLAEIGERLGITRQAVHFKIQRFSIDTSHAERFDVNCDGCGKPHSITRRRYRGAIKHFCTMICYREYLQSAEYRRWQQGQRIGRTVMEKALERSLVPGEVVHHIDGDSGNNDLSNLMLFKSNVEHAAYHHKLQQEHNDDRQRKG